MPRVSHSSIVNRDQNTNGFNNERYQENYRSSSIMQSDNGNNGESLYDKQNYASINSNTQFGNFEEKEGQNQDIAEIKRQSISNNGKDTKGKDDDPNVIQFSNNNGPETFTITHKT